MLDWQAIGYLERSKLDMRHSAASASSDYSDIDVCMSNISIVFSFIIFADHSIRSSSSCSKSAASIKYMQQLISLDLQTPSFYSKCPNAWLRSLVARALDLRLDGREFDFRPPLLVLGWMTVFGLATHFCISPSHPGQLSLLAYADGKWVAVKVQWCWGVKAGWLIPVWINVWVAGKTVWFLAIPERFRDEYRTYYKALDKCPAYLINYNTKLSLGHNNILFIYLFIHLFIHQSTSR